MRKYVVLLAVALLASLTVSAQKAKSYDDGYLFVKPLKSHSKQSLKSRVKSTITPGRVATIYSDDPNELLGFCLVDAAEYFKLGKGSYYKYYPIAQDIVPAEYVSVAEFNKATQKVKVYHDAPASIEVGKRYSFKPKNPKEYSYPATVRLIRLGSNVRLVTEVDYENNFRPLSYDDVSGKTVIELRYPDLDHSAYIFNGKQIFLASNLAGQDYSSLTIDDNGTPYAVDDKGNRRQATDLSVIEGEIPEIGYIGWISATELVINDLLYVR